MSSELIRKVRSELSLYDAWRTVRSNALKSQNEQTRNDVREYEISLPTNIHSLCGRLKNPARFEFDKAWGTPVPRKGDKADRPIVVGTIDNRIVQRSILNALQSQPEIAVFSESPTSFGGIRNRSVEKAIGVVNRAISEGKTWFARSDIRDFFVNIPRKMVVDMLNRLISDPEFVQFFEKSLQTELANLAALRGKANLFPIEEIGVAQGSSLSPLVGNMLLHDFDRKLNDRGIVCVRYIDDFVILGHRKRDLERAVSNALRILSDLGLNAYDPIENDSKGGFGQIGKTPMEFLGVQIDKSYVRPSEKSRQRFLDKIDNILKKSTILFSDPSRCYESGASVVDTLSRIDGTLQGWVTQYGFCTDPRVLNQLNRRVDKRLRGYLGRYADFRSRTKDLAKLRKVLGVRWLEDKDWTVPTT